MDGMDHLTQIIEEVAEREREKKAATLSDFSGICMSIAMIAALYGIVLYDSYHVHPLLAAAPAIVVALFASIADIAAFFTHKE